MNSIQLNQGSLAVEATGTGNSGNLTVNVKTVNLDNGSEISASTKSGIGQSVTLDNLETLNLNNKSQISTSTETVKAGDISINNQQTPIKIVELTNNSQIAAQATAEKGEAGSVNINSNIVNLEQNSAISASNQSGNIGGDVKLQNIETLQVKEGS